MRKHKSFPFEEVEISLTSSWLSKFPESLRTSVEPNPLLLLFFQHSGFPGVLTSHYISIRTFPALFGAGRKSCGTIQYLLLASISHITSWTVCFFYVLCHICIYAKEKHSMGSQVHLCICTSVRLTVRPMWTKFKRVVPLVPGTCNS